MLGAEVVPVTTGSRTLKDAINEAFRDWVTTVETTHYCIGSVMGPHPFPVMVRDFQRVIGVEAREQVLAAAGRLPDAVIACVGGGSNAIGVFHAFIPDDGRAPDRLRGRRRRAGERPARRHGRRRLGRGDPRHADLPAAGRRRARPCPTHSISAGLDYPGVGPEHAWLHDTGRASYRAGHRRRGDGRVRAALPDRGDHPGHRVRARAGRGAAGRAGARPGRAAAGQPVRAAATRTWTPPPAGSVTWPGSGRERGPDERPGRAPCRRVRAGRRARAGRRWSATCRPGFPRCRRRDRGGDGDGRGRAPTSSRSACRTPTR